MGSFLWKSDSQLSYLYGTRKEDQVKTDMMWVTCEDDEPGSTK